MTVQKLQLEDHERILSDQKRYLFRPANCFGLDVIVPLLNNNGKVAGHLLLQSKHYSTKFGAGHFVSAMNSLQPSQFLSSTNSHASWLKSLQNTNVQAKHWE
jgi:hypothetical protein